MAQKGTDYKFTSYSEFIRNIDPSKEEEACLLRSGLIYPSNQSLIQQKYHTNSINCSTNNNSHHNDNIHHEFYKKLYRCYLCREEYINKDSLNKHIKMRHLINNTDISDIIIPKWYCTKCKNEFSYKPSNNNNNQIKHFCLNSKQEIDKIDKNTKNGKKNHKNGNIKLCAINNNGNNENDALSIKRVRYECRINNDLSSIEQWLKYELIKRKLTRNDYLNASKMFIGVQGYKIAIQLLQKSQTLQNHNECTCDDDIDADGDTEQTLIFVAKKLIKQSN